MKTLSLYSKKYAYHTVYYDNEDEYFVSQHSWYVWKAPTSDLYYARTHIRIDGKQTTRLFHRLLLNIVDPKTDVDHIDHNGLNNQRENLRVCLRINNSHNRRKTTQKQSSQYKGVYFVANPSYSSRPWRARICIEGKRINIGNFSKEEDAALAYNIEAKKYFGEFAYMSII